MDKSARNDALAAILVLLVVAPFAATTGDIYVDPLDPGFSAQDFPIGVLGLIVILALSLLIKGVLGMRRDGVPVFVPGEMRDIWRYVVPMGAIGFLYVWFIELFQYPFPTLIAVAAALAMFGNQGWARLATAPFVAVVVYYLLFYGLLGLHEAPGSILTYDNQVFFRPMRDALGLF